MLILGQHLNNFKIKGEEMISKDGMIVAYQDVDKMVAINKLPEVTNPIYLTVTKYGKTPTPDGLLSYEIFGVGENRKHRMAYIDLKIHYMNPNSAFKLKTFSKECHDILYSKEKYRLEDGVLIKDPDKGKTGSEFLYSIWDKIKFKEKTTVTTKEIEDAFKNIPKNLLFITKCPVIPAALRDIDTSGEKIIGIDEINDIYSKIISYTKNIDNNIDGFNIMMTATAARIQTLLDEIYTKLIIDKVKGNPSKYGFNKRYVVAKNIGFTSRAVVTANELNVESIDRMPVKFGITGLPIAQAVGLFFPFINKYIKDFFQNEFGSKPNYTFKKYDGTSEVVEVENRYDDVYIQDALQKFIKSPAFRIQPIPVPCKDKTRKLYMAMKGYFKKDNTSIKRRMTWLDIIYLAAVDVCENGKHMDLTRYPVTSENSQFATKIRVLTTNKTIPVLIGERVYEFYPHIDENTNPHNAFIDSVMTSSVYESQLGMDYDGDQTSQKSRFTNEANLEAEKQINSKPYYVSISGKWMRNISMEFVLTAYMLTKTDGILSKNVNLEKPMFEL